MRLDLLDGLIESLAPSSSRTWIPSRMNLSKMSASLAGGGGTWGGSSGAMVWWPPPPAGPALGFGFRGCLGGRVFRIARNEGNATAWSNV